MTAVAAPPAVAPPRDLSPAARAERFQAELLGRRHARRIAWRASHGNRAEYRRLMAAWLANRARP